MSTVAPEKKGQMTWEELDNLSVRLKDQESPLATTVASQQISFNINSGDTVNLASRFTILLGSDVSGGAITIKKGTDSAKPLETFNGVAVVALKSGYYDIVETATEFILVTQSVTPRDNILINSDFTRFDYGDSFVDLNNIFVSNRWKLLNSGAVQVRVDKDLPLSSNFKNSIRVEATATISGGTNVYSDLLQYIEEPTAYNNDELSISVGIKADLGVEYVVFILDASGVLASTGRKVGTGLFEVFSATGSLPTLTTLRAVIRTYRENITVGEGLNVQYVKVERGNNSTKYERDTPEKIETQCQRYLYQIKNTSATNGSIIGFAIAIATTSLRVGIPLKTNLRTAPTLTKVDLGSGAIRARGAGGAILNITAETVTVLYDSGNLTLQFNGTYVDEEVYMIEILNYELNFSAEL